VSIVLLAKHQIVIDKLWITLNGNFELIVPLGYAYSADCSIEKFWIVVEIGMYGHECMHVAHKIKDVVRKGDGTAGEEAATSLQGT
jgi:hypothetical protein